MLITPKDIRDYTSFNDVRRRTDYQLEFDIVLAEQEVFSYVGHKFTDEQYATLPVEVTVALVRLAEYNALVNSDESITKGYKSINLAGELQYQLPDGDPVNKSMIFISLKEHMDSGTAAPGETKVKFRMRFL